MARFKKPTPEEVSRLRVRLLERARSGALRYPFAVVEIRKSLGLSQEEFANLLRMSRRQISEIEQGNANPTAETLERIGKIFNFTIGFVPRRPQEDEAESPFKP